MQLNEVAMQYILWEVDINNNNKQTQKSAVFD